MVWSWAVEDDRLKLLGVFQQALAKGQALGLPGADVADPYWATGMVVSGNIPAVWVGDHTLLLYKVSNFTWYAKDCRIMQELLAFKYAAEPRQTFRQTLEVMLAIADYEAADYLVVGNTLTPHPERVRNLYLRHGFSQAGGQLVKEL